MRLGDDKLSAGNVEPPAGFEPAATGYPAIPGIWLHTATRPALYRAELRRLSAQSF
jgi:hypothetical protein